MKTKLLILSALFFLLIAIPAVAHDKRRSLVHKRYERCRTEYFLKYKMNSPTRSKATYSRSRVRYPRIRVNKSFRRRR